MTLGAVALALVLNGCLPFGSAPPVYPGPQPDDPKTDPDIRVLHKGDKLSIQMTGPAWPTQPPPPHIEDINQFGFISMPQIGNIQADGKTPKDVQDAIKEAYITNRIYTEALNVAVEQQDKSFAVNGEVHMPSGLEYKGTTTLMQAISRAQGFTDFANRKKVWLIRANGKRFAINCEAITKGNAPNPSVRPGDTIQVDKSLY